MKKKKSTKKISSKELDRKFEKNEESILQFFDTENPIKRVNVDFNQNTVSLLDEFAKKLNVTRQSLIKFWINDRIKEEISELKKEA